MKILISLAFVVLMPISSALAQQVSDYFYVDQVSLQWDASDLLIYPETGHTFVNPAGCSSTGSYSSDSVNNGYKERYALALAALLEGRQIAVVIHPTACSQSTGRPRVMSVKLK